MASTGVGEGNKTAAGSSLHSKTLLKSQSLYQVTHPRHQAMFHPTARLVRAALTDNPCFASSSTYWNPPCSRASRTACGSFASPPPPTPCESRRPPDPLAARSVRWLALERLLHGRCLTSVPVR